jgi:hypothetical protein
MQTKVVIALAAGLCLGVALADGAFAQTSRDGDKIPASAHTERLLKCRALARQHNFGFHFIRKGRFMRSCLKLEKL